MIQGIWSDGRTAATRPVLVSVDSSALVIQTPDGETLASWPAEQVRFADTPTDGVLRLRLDDGSLARLRLQAQDRIAVEQACRHLLRRDLNSGFRLRPILLWSAGAAAGLLLSLFVLIPWAADIIAENLPVEAEQKFGEQAEAGILKWFGFSRDGRHGPMVCTSAHGQAVLNASLERLTAGQPTRLPLKIQSVNIPMVNAFALPGGRILITRGLLQSIEGEGELAGVLAHEIAHIEARHNLSGIVKRGAVGFLIGLFFGDALGGFTTLGLAEAMINAAYTRDMEMQADQLAIRRMQAAGLDPATAAPFFARLAKFEQSETSKMFAFISTHPELDQRAALFTAAARPGAQPMLQPAEWQALKLTCGAKT